MARSSSKLLLGSSAISTMLALLLLILGLWRSILESEVTRQQARMGQIQNEVNRGLMSWRITQSLVRDLTPLAANKAEIRLLLSRYGMTVNRDAPADLP